MFNIQMVRLPLIACQAVSTDSTAGPQLPNKELIRRTHDDQTLGLSKTPGELDVLDRGQAVQVADCNDLP